MTSLMEPPIVVLWRQVVFWGKKKQSATIPVTLQLNDRVLVETEDGKYLSRVEDVSCERILIAGPLEGSNIDVPRKGKKVVINVFSDAGLRRFEATVAQSTSHPLPLLSLVNFKYIGILQRRQHVRLNERVTVYYKRHPNDEKNGDWRTGWTQDISAGGLRLETSDDDMTVGDILEIELSLPGEGTVMPVGRVARISEIGSRGSSLLSIGVQFIGILPSEVSLISRYIFRRQAEIRDFRRNIVRLRSNTPVRALYRVEGAREKSWREATVRDLGQGGLRMEVTETVRFTKGQCLEVRLNLHSGEKVVGNCEVVRISHERAGTGKTCHVGIKFPALDGATRAAIQEFLLGLSEEKPGGESQAA